MADEMPPKLTAPPRSLLPQTGRSTSLTSDGVAQPRATPTPLASDGQALPRATPTPLASDGQALPRATPTLLASDGQTLPRATPLPLAAADDPILPRAIPLPAKQTMPLAPLQPRSDRIGMFLTSDDQLLTRHVEETHVPNGSPIDVRPLFQLIEDIIARSTQTLFAPGPGAQVPKEAMMIEGKDSFTTLVSIPDLPLIIDRIFCEMACKSWVGSNAHDATISVLKLLAHFPWEAKVVLTLAAFALTYGEFWLLAQNYSANPLANSMARLKQLRLVTEQSGSFTHQFDAVNKLIKAILNVTRCFVDFKDLPSIYIMEEEPTLKAIKNYFPIAVYWTIRSIVGAAAHITTLTSSGHEYSPSTAEAWEISNWEHKLTTIYDHFMSIIRRLTELIEKKREDEAYETLQNFIYKMIHIDNIPVLIRLIDGKADPLPLYDCSYKRQVQLEVLRGKNVLLLISDLNISQEELSMLEQIYNETKLHQYEIVWIPIVDRSIQWSDVVQARFEGLLGPMRWYSVYQPSKLDAAVIKFVRDDWNFMGKPILVVLDPQGKVVSPNAIHMMYIWGSTAFPFTSKREEALWLGESWKLELLVDAIDHRISDLIRDGKYILMHGGDDIEWIRKFTGQARIVADSAGIKLEMVYVGKSHAQRNAISKVTAAILSDDLSLCLKDPTTVWSFWRRIQSMLLSKIQLEQADNHSDIITQEIKRLLSYDRSPGGWALLAEGSTVVLHGHGSTFYTTLLQYEKEWKNEVALLGFARAIQAHKRKFDIREAPYCARFDFPTSVGRIPKGMQCPECNLAMEKQVTFVCCHEGALASAELTSPLPQAVPPAV
ncbi:hypothetical protein Nepgr_026693 [Nepenthes gracilis]|uniref:Protein SIEVE ELEMENT OCCLUSION B-like n=1 Tax=Nepenthes gracilis TaxID=150966 RepID=A0AAD3T8F0_NEPGR|nr:hypothetical protein Nepgr_026693 [Nepenthes gracilis]